MKELERLAIDIQNGDEAAFAKMYELLAPSILNHIYKIIGDKAKSEDILHEVLIEAADRWVYPATFSAAQ